MARVLLLYDVVLLILPFPSSGPPNKLGPSIDDPNGLSLKKGSLKGDRAPNGEAPNGEAPNREGPDDDRAVGNTSAKNGSLANWPWKSPKSELKSSKGSVNTKGRRARPKKGSAPYVFSGREYDRVS